MTEGMEEPMRDALATHAAYIREQFLASPRWRARTLPVRDIMSAPAHRVDVSLSFAEARALLANREIPHLLVFRDNRLAGVLSHEEIVAYLSAADANGGADTLREVLQDVAPPVTVGPETPVQEAATLMLHYAVTSLPVCSHSGGVIGVVTSRDLLHLLVN